MRVIDGIKTKIFPAACEILIAGGRAFFMLLGTNFQTPMRGKSQIRFILRFYLFCDTMCEEIRILYMAQL